MENKPTLYIMCGPSGCGKTTWARKYLASNPNMKYISRDEIRFSLVTENENYFSKEKNVFNKFAETIKQFLIDGFDVIADATHLNYKSRQKLINRFKNIDYNIIFVAFMINRNNAILQNNLRKGRECVPENIIRWQFDNYSFPSKEDNENCKGVWMINGF